MNDRSSTAGIFALAGIALVLVAFILKGIVGSFSGRSNDTAASPHLSKKSSSEPGVFHRDLDSTAAPESDEDALAALLLDFFLSASNDPNTLPKEALLRFKSRDAFEKFLAAARALGLDIKGELASLNTARVGFDKLSQLRDALDGLADDLDSVAGNYAVTVPDIPLETDQRSSTGQAAPFNNNLLEYLGVTADNSSFGSGVKIAILDSGLADHPTFNGTSITRFDLTESGLAAALDPAGHGTAVASLISGTLDQASGISPAAQLLAYRVTDAEGNSDSFTLAQGIIAASDAGADLINISLGSYGDSQVVIDAISYARSKNALIIAAAGNEQLVDASFPARYQGVVSVGGTDANGTQLWFSNASPTLDLGAPGYEINAAAPGDSFATFTGTSASAPVVTGAVAAVMSELNISDPYLAYQLVTTTSNEAGAPGQDSAYGNGIVDLGRALNNYSQGISDAAVASHYYDQSGAYGFGPDQMLFVVENRGTTPLANIPLSVSQNGQTQNYVFSRIAPNESAVFPVQVDVGQLSDLGTIPFTSQLYYPGQGDSQAGNNSLSTALIEPEN